MRGQLMRLWTEAEHKQILTDFTSSSQAAARYTEDGRGPVSRQIASYWRTIFIEKDGNLAWADRELKQDRTIVVPSPDDDIGQDINIPAGPIDRILVIPDLHAPYQHQDALAFLKCVKETFKPECTVNLGDELDYHALSFHDSDPNLDSAGVELERGREFLTELHAVFPDMLICHSNHGSMVYRKAKAHGIPVQMLKKYRHIIFQDHGAPGWSWAFHWKLPTVLGKVMFKHQASSVLVDAAHNCCNLVVGHNHGDFKIEFSASSEHLYYGAVCGCLIDKDSLAFAYGRNTMRKPIIGCMMILKGRPILVPMIMGRDGRWIKKL